jgi:hypothetical protein
LYDSRFGTRGRGEGLYAEAIQSLFHATARRLGLATGFDEDAPSPFKRPSKPGDQLPLL